MTSETTKRDMQSFISKTSKSNVKKVIYGTAILWCDQSVRKLQNIGRIGCLGNAGLIKQLLFVSESISQKLDLAINKSQPENTKPHSFAKITKP